MEKDFLKIGIVGKPFIGKSDDEWNKNIVINGNLNNIVYKSGNIPIGLTPISPEEHFNKVDDVDSYRLSDFDKQRVKRQIKNLDGVILQGGMQTLAYEEFLAKCAIANGVPIMGICAGFNTLVRVCGGWVMSDETCTHDKEPDKLAHSLMINPESNFYRLMGEKATIEVNSVHWMIAPIIGIPRSLNIAALSPDKLVEVVEGVSKPIFGYKFHPEVMAQEQNKTYNPQMQNIFDDFFERCHEYHLCKKVENERIM